MKRTTVKIPDELDARLRREAELRGTTVSGLVREAIEAFLGGRPRHRRRLSFIGIGDSGFTDTGQRFEEILEGYIDDIYADAFGLDRPRHRRPVRQR